MHSVVETHSFQRAARSAGMTEEDVAGLIEILARNPMAGDEIVGTSGCRKLRLAGKGKGKSGGYRSITFYSGQHMPVFLITVFAKGDRANLSRAECNALATITKRIVESYHRVPRTSGDRS